jgi:hypothetical protein
MAIYEMTDRDIVGLKEKTFAELGIRERDDLQAILRNKVEIISPDTLVIAEEFCDWEDSRRRIDLLGIDKDANLVVIELKTTRDGGHMELQAIRYAAMVSAMTFEKAVSTLAAHMARMGQDGSAEKKLLDHLSWSEPQEEDFAQDVRLVLCSADFSKEISTAVMWLNDRGLDIRCVRMRPYRHGDRTLIDIQQILPLPEAHDYQVRLSEKAGRERTERRSKSQLGEVLQQFWTGLLEKANQRTDIHSNITPGRDHWCAAGAGSVSGLGFVYAIGRDHPRVELSISTGDKARNKAIFDRIHRLREQIEQDFGDSIVWERRDSGMQSLVRYELDVPWTRDESAWPEMQRAMVDAMVRLEKALRPALDELKTTA